jgi:hypothetical protein
MEEAATREVGFNILHKANKRRILHLHSGGTSTGERAGTPATRTSYRSAFARAPFQARAVAETSVSYMPQ